MNVKEQAEHVFRPSLNNPNPPHLRHSPKNHTIEQDHFSPTGAELNEQNILQLDISRVKCTMVSKICPRLLLAVFY